MIRRFYHNDRWGWSRNAASNDITSFIFILYTILCKSLIDARALVFFSSYTMWIEKPGWLVGVLPVLYGSNSKLDKPTFVYLEIYRMHSYSCNAIWKCIILPLSFVNLDFCFLFFLVLATSWWVLKFFTYFENSSVDFMGWKKKKLILVLEAKFRILNIENLNKFHSFVRTYIPKTRIRIARNFEKCHAHDFEFSKNCR